MNKIYKCECGKEFKSSQSINGHKANCVVHLSNKFNDAEKILQDRHNKSSKNSAKSRKIRSIKYSQRKLDIWISEQHKCEKCGKIMSEYYGSGRFCSEFCARGTSNYKGRDNDYINYENVCTICDKRFKKMAGLNHHLKLMHKDYYRQTSLVKLGNLTLDITYNDLHKYKESVRSCEICGKSVETIISDSSHFKNLCIDHNHSNNTFRGLLCNTCNRCLGWFENNEHAVLKYLDDKGRQ